MRPTARATRSRRRWRASMSTGSTRSSRQRGDLRGFHRVSRQVAGPCHGRRLHRSRSSASGRTSRRSFGPWCRSMLEARPNNARSMVPGQSTNTGTASPSSSSPSTSPSSSSSSSSSTPPAPSPWMTADETACVLDTTAHTLRRLAREDRSPVVARRIGGRWRFARRDVERYVSGEPPYVERKR